MKLPPTTSCHVSRNLQRLMDHTWGLASVSLSYTMHSWSLTVQLEKDLRQQHKAKYVTELVWGVCHIYCKAPLGAPLRYYIPEKEQTIVWLTTYSTIFPLHSFTWKKLQIVGLEKRLNYMKITVCGDISLFQIDDNSGAMYSSPTQSSLSQHKAFLIPIVAERGNSAHVAFFLLISDKGKALYNQQASGYKVHAQDATLISSVSLFLSLPHCVHFSFHFTLFVSCCWTTPCWRHFGYVSTNKITSVTKAITWFVN